MRLRQSGNDEYKKYDIVSSDNFDLDLAEKNIKDRHKKQYEKREDKRKTIHYKKQQRILNKCNMCFFQDGKFEFEYVVAESEHCYVSFPTKTSPLHPQDRDQFSHLVIAPKYHYSNFLEIEEEVQVEVRNYQKSIVAFFKECFNMQTVFIETSIQDESGKRIAHAMIDCVGFPLDDENAVDIEVFF